MDSAGSARLGPHEALLSEAGRALVDALTPYHPATAMSRLEAVRAEPRWADQPDVVAAAATQARLRTRAATRFPGPVRWWTPDGLEQATRPVVAARHAARFVEAGVTRVLDLGCGVGSDALALAAAGLEVVAVDRDPQALWALRATAHDRALAMGIRRGDVTELIEDLLGEQSSARGSLADLGCFVDPARRREGSRVLAPAGWSPPWGWVRDLAERLPSTGAKVAPGIDHAVLPLGSQAEWTSVAGELLEAAVWWGPLRRGSATRVATVLGAADLRASPARMGTEPVASSREGDPPPGHRPTRPPVDWAQLDDARGVPVPAVGPWGDWLVEPDPAVIRAGLVSVLAERLDGWLLDPRIAYISTSALPEPGLLGSAYAVRCEVPFARKQLRAWLREHGYGNVVIKKRGINVVPEQLRAALRLDGGGPTATLVLTRTDAGPLALLVERL